MQVLKGIKIRGEALSFRYLLIVFVVFIFIFQSCFTKSTAPLIWENFKLISFEKTKSDFSNEVSPIQISNSTTLNIGSAISNINSLNRVYLAISIFQESNYRAKILNLFRAEIQNVKIDPMRGGLMSTLANASKADNEISFLALFSHGAANSIWGDHGFKIRTRDLDNLELCIKLGEINFSKDAVIYLGGCNAGTHKRGRSFAQTLADISGATVYALVDDSVAPVHESLKFTFLPKMTYGPEHRPDSQFHVFTPQNDSRPIGTTVDLIELFDETRMKQDANDWESQLAVLETTGVEGVGFLKY